MLLHDVDRMLQQLQQDRSSLPTSLLPAHRTAVLRAYDRYLRQAGAVRHGATAARSPQDVRTTRSALQRLSHLPGTGQGLTRLLGRADTGYGTPLPSSSPSARCRPRSTTSRPSQRR